MNELFLVLLNVDSDHTELVYVSPVKHMYSDIFP